jgi:hypothetical protein
VTTSASYAAKSTRIVSSTAPITADTASNPFALRASRVCSSLNHNSTSQLIKELLLADVTRSEVRAAKVVEHARPYALRAYDQIPMRSLDLLRQVKLIASYYAGKSVVFVGDYDGTSLLTGLLSKQQCIPSPARMLLLDFDERLLRAARKLAERYGFIDLLEARLYNVFDLTTVSFTGHKTVLYQP